mgnify:CR=1 FL=1
MTLEEKIIEELKRKNLTITTTESCTGGLLAGRLLNVPGASAVFSEGYITYSNEAKERLVGVSRETLQKYGAVSKQTAMEMAQGVAKVAKADVGLSTTGFAGPDGEPPEKPAGLIYVACCIDDYVTYVGCRFTGNREENRDRAVRAALQLLWRRLQEMDEFVC